MGCPEKKMVLRLDLHDDKGKQKAMKIVSSLLGINSIAMDMKDKKMTVIGIVDPVVVVTKLRKSWHTEIISIGLAKESKKEEKKDDSKKEKPTEEPKKKEKSKDEPKKEGKKEETKKEVMKKDPGEQVAELVRMYRAYNPYMTAHYVVHSTEEDPNLCVIC